MKRFFRYFVEGAVASVIADFLFRTFRDTNDNE